MTYFERQISNQAMDQIVTKNVRNQVVDQVTRNVRNQITKLVWDPVWDRTSNQFFVKDQVGNQVLHQLFNEICK
jgi:uncharacterized protein YbcI